MKRKIEKEEAVILYNRQMELVERGANKIHRVVSFSMNNTFGLQRAIQSVERGNILWEHNKKYHCIAMYIERDRAMYNRDILDMIATGIDSEEKFIELWEQENDNNKGYIPKKKNSSKTSSVRKQQQSYIVANQTKGENHNSNIEGYLNPNITHRTHLISFGFIGIESHKGLIIDYDGWLNIHPMKESEKEIEVLSKRQDIIWKTEVYKVQQGLVVKYLIYDADYKLLYTHRFLDDRWEYVWKYD